MPWKECKPMDERIKFVGRLLNGEKMSVLCREFGISRKTGYKFFNRYKIDGVTRLEDQARRPYRHANRLPCQVEKTILSETSASNGNFPAGGRLRSEIKSSTSSPPSNPLLSALCTLSLTATAPPLLYRATQAPSVEVWMPTIRAISWCFIPRRCHRMACSRLCCCTSELSFICHLFLPQL